MNVVELENVTHSYNHSLALDEITLAVGEGEFLAVLGANGAGKSTLLKVITGTLKPDRGEVRIMGRPVTAMGRSRDKIGYLPQAGNVNPTFPISALQVVMMGLYSEMGWGRLPRKSHRLKAGRALEKVGVASLASRPIGELSGGERQRVLLARALVNDPELLLLDEPTTGIDTASLEKFHGLLQEFHAGGVAIVMVSHDIGVVASFVDRVACLNHRLVAHGKPEAVLGEKTLEEMYGCHTVFFDHGDRPHMVVKKHTR